MDKISYYLTSILEKSKIYKNEDDISLVISDMKNNKHDFVIALSIVLKLDTKSTYSIFFIYCRITIAPLQEISDMTGSLVDETKRESVEEDLIEKFRKPSTLFTIHLSDNTLPKVYIIIIETYYSYFNIKTSPLIAGSESILEQSLTIRLLEEIGIKDVNYNDPDISIINKNKITLNPNQSNILNDILKIRLKLLNRTNMTISTKDYYVISTIIPYLDSSDYDTILDAKTILDTFKIDEKLESNILRIKTKKM